MAGVGGGGERAAATKRGKGMPGRSVAEVRARRPWGQRYKRESWKMKMQRKIKVT